MNNIIDLKGPEGNAWVRMGYAQSLGRQIGFTGDEIDNIIDKMKCSDYENLVSVFVEFFGDYVVIRR